MHAAATIRADVLRRLRARVTAGRRSRAAGVLATGWAAIDERLPGGGLARGAMHEWIGTLAETAQTDRTQERRVGFGWRPPLGLMMHLTHVMCTASGAGQIVWVGPKAWPYPIALQAHRLGLIDDAQTIGQMPATTHKYVNKNGRTSIGTPRASLLERSLFVRAGSAAERLFAALLVLRSRSVVSVIVDGTGFDLTATRRLQHVAETGAAFCLLARPPHERHVLSAAMTRWLVRSAPSSQSKTRTQRWIVELLRCKGLPPACSEAPLLWSLERDHATGDVVMAADMGDGRRASSTSADERRTG